MQSDFFFSSIFLKTDLISFFIYDLCYKFWFSRPAKCVKLCIQLSQMSIMSNTRSRAQYITLKLVSLESVPLNWVKRCYFLLLSPNALSGGHFVEHTE